MVTQITHPSVKTILLRHHHVDVRGKRLWDIGPPAHHDHHKHQIYIIGVAIATATAVAPDKVIQ